MKLPQFNCALPPEHVDNIARALCCRAEELEGFSRLEQGMTNSSYVFSLRGERYVYRLPGAGSELLINRLNEKRSLEIASEYGLDSSYICMSPSVGWKISRYISDYREPDYASAGDCRRVSALFRRLHSVPVKTDYGLEPQRDVEALEARLSTAVRSKYSALRQRVLAMHALTVGDGVEHCFCHGDAYKPNIMLRDDGSAMLVDWEYAGWADPGVDIGYYIVDAGYDFPAAEAFISEYLGEKNDNLIFHFMSYAALAAYYWTVWAEYREQSGYSTKGALGVWREMAYKYSQYEQKETKK